MKPVLAAAIGACVLLLEGDALAQTAARPDPVARADVLGVVGWLHVDRSDLDPYGAWVSRIGFVGGGMGWYWTDHLKTEVDAGVRDPLERAPIELHVGHPLVAQPLAGGSEHASGYIRAGHVRRAVAQQQSGAPPANADLEDVVVRLHIGSDERPLDQLDVLSDVLRCPRLSALPLIAKVLGVGEPLAPSCGVLVPSTLVVDAAEGLGSRHWQAPGRD